MVWLKLATVERRVVDCKLTLAAVLKTEETVPRFQLK